MNHKNADVQLTAVMDQAMAELLGVVTETARNFDTVEHAIDWMQRDIEKRIRKALSGDRQIEAMLMVVGWGRMLEHVTEVEQTRRELDHGDNK